MKRLFETYCWMGEIHQQSNEDTKNYLEFLRNNGVSGIIYRTDRPEFPFVSKVAKDFGLKVEGWYPTLICINKDYSIDRSCYAVSKLGESTLDKQPYVEYYKWLCPNNPKTLDYIQRDLDYILNNCYIDSIHLDYIRYCDIYLPEGLWGKYDLIMDRVFPEFDFCYCDICRDKFKTTYGVDPLYGELSEDLLLKWNQFRLNSVSNLVSSIKNIVKSRNKEISAAVFPGPSLAIQNVLQEWSKWELDRYFPMNYNNFYKENGLWVGKMVNEETTATSRDIYSGIYLHNLELNEFEDAVKSSIENRAKGLGLFVPEDMSDKHWAILKKYSKLS